MDSDKVENREEANTFEGAHGYSKKLKKIATSMRKNVKNDRNVTVETAPKEA